MAQKEKTLTETIGEMIASVTVKPIHNFVKWGAQSAWKAAIVVVVLGGAVAAADRYLGAGNAVTVTIQQEQAAAAPSDPSVTIITPSGTTVAQ